MKRIIVAILAAWVLTIGSGVALAEEEHAEHGEQGTEIEAGLKTWWNKWERTSAEENFTSDRTFLLGPVVEAKFRNRVFVEASYLGSTSDYKFTDVDGTAVNFERNDLDLAVGYLFRKEVGVFAGYRNAAFKNNLAEKETVYGPLAGIRANIPVNEALSFYGILTYLMNRFKFEEAGFTSRERCPGWIAEAGLKYEITKQVSASLGYKYEKTRTSETNISDAFSGLTLGAMYAFE